MGTDVDSIQIEVLAICAQLRGLGHPDTADLVERWAARSEPATEAFVEATAPVVDRRHR